MKKIFIPIISLLVLISGCGTNIPEASVKPILASARFAAIAALPFVPGRTLTTTDGVWENNPTKFTYQWLGCNTNGELCLPIAGANTNSYTISNSDVGKTIRIEIRAFNEGGESSQTSNPTGEVKNSSNTNIDCFKSPGMCGYPDPAYNNVGIEKGKVLSKKNGSIIITNSGSVVKEQEIIGNIEVKANNVIFENDNLVGVGHQKGCSSPCGAGLVKIYPGISGTVFNHVECHGSESSGENALHICFRNESSSITKYNYVKVYNVAPGFMGASSIENSYCIMNVVIPNEHYECVLNNGTGGNMVIKHNTLLNPKEETADIFLSVDFGNENEILIENNLLAGGGYSIYGGAKGTGGKVVGPVKIRNNRFARCAGHNKPGKGGEEEKMISGGVWVCPKGADNFGYWPRGGAFGAFAYINESVTTISGNYWDDNTKEEVK